LYRQGETGVLKTRQARQSCLGYGKAAALWYEALAWLNSQWLGVKGSMQGERHGKREVAASGQEESEGSFRDSAAQQSKNPRLLRSATN